MAPRSTAATALLELPTLTARHFAQDNAKLNALSGAPITVLKVWNQT